MNPATPAEVLRETDHLQKHRGNPSAHPTPHELCSHEQAPPCGPVGPYAPDEDAVETFVGGAGI
jgi:hypothetical protein